MNILIYDILNINALPIFIFKMFFYLRCLNDGNLFEHLSLMPQLHFVQHAIEYADLNDDFYFLPFFLFLFLILLYIISF